MAANLLVAAGTAFDNLQTLWLADGLKAALESFWAQAITTFPDGGVGGRPIANWCTVIAQLAAEMEDTNVPYTELTAAAAYVLRICWLGDQLESQGSITAPQAAALLDAYNDHIE